MTVPVPPGARQRTTLTLACLAVGFAAADTYVVVLALPDMMAGVGLNPDELQRAAPIVSGFLLGYVAMLPLIGRIADLRGRLPVLVFSLLVFAFGSLVTAASEDLTPMVVGRFLQGLGGGGLVPATLALVADLWPPRRRGVSLGVVGAVQELGSVLGPLYGALVLALWQWPAIFWINLLVALLLASWLALLRLGARRPAPGADRWSVVLVLVAVGAFALLITEPEPLASLVTLGLAWVPLAGGSVLSAPLTLACLAAVAAFVVRDLTTARPVVGLRSLARLSRYADLPGAALLGLALAGIVLAFATADPEVQVFSPLGPWFLAGSTLAGAGFLWRQARASYPLVPRRALAAPPAWGALLVNFFIGSALIAALVDVPIFARVTEYPDSQLGAALVLVRLLAALPVGALLGGVLVRRLPPGPITGVGMLAAAGSFVAMTRWEDGTLAGAGVGATVALVVCGLGFGLAIAPVNAALLAATKQEVHGVSSALVVVARMVGMLVGISVLTTIGLARYYARERSLPPPTELCPGEVTQCAEYADLLREAGLVQLHTVFAGAAGCALVAGIAAVLLLPRNAPR
ncbi:MAG: MFS transporter [Propionibacteriales bacterium]|nr:MFS transporter [Propionibacteriales bacterium]